MRHKAQSVRWPAIWGAVLCLAAAAEGRAQMVLRQPLAQEGVASNLRVQPMTGELLPANSVEAALKSLADQAAVIFTGSVAQVNDLPGGSASVIFAVEDGLRGVGSGDRYTMRVSAWGGGVERYRVGERALFLLLAPSAQGFSSPVGGELGIVPLSGDALVGTVDLRWVATMVQRTVTTAAEAPASAALQVSGAVQAASALPIPFVSAGSGASTGPQVGFVRGASMKEQLAMSNVTGVDVHAIDRDLVTGMVRTWASAAASAAGGTQ